MRLFIKIITTDTKIRVNPQMSRQWLYLLERRVSYLHRLKWIAITIDRATFRCKIANLQCEPVNSMRFYK